MGEEAYATQTTKAKKDEEVMSPWTTAGEIKDKPSQRRGYSSELDDLQSYAA